MARVVDVLGLFAQPVGVIFSNRHDYRNDVFGLYRRGPLVFDNTHAGLGLYQGKYSAFWYQSLIARPDLNEQYETAADEKFEPPHGLHLWSNFDTDALFVIYDRPDIEIIVGLLGGAMY